MKGSELTDILEQDESSKDAVIASNPYHGFTARSVWRPDNYFHFIVTEHRWQSCAKRSSIIAALEMTAAIIGCSKPFAKLKNQQLSDIVVCKAWTTETWAINQHIKSFWMI